MLTIDNTPRATPKRCQSVMTTKTLVWLSCIIILMHDRALAFLPSTSSRSNTSPISSTSIRNKSQRFMVAKSGGKPIASTQQFEEEVLLSSNNNAKKDKLILVLFTAPWCGPCRLTNPVVKETSKQYQSKLDVVEINTDDLPEVAESTGVTSIPTIQIYHGGKVRDTIVGCVSKNVLGKAVDKVLEDLGMLGNEKDDDLGGVNDS